MQNINNLAPVLRNARVGMGDEMHNAKRPRAVGQGDFNAEVVQAAGPVLVAFIAPWSRPCRILEAVLDELAGSGQAKMKLVTVDADDNPDLSLWYEVQAIPTLLYFLNGTLRARIVGTVTKEAILAKLRDVSS